MGKRKKRDKKKKNQATSSGRLKIKSKKSSVVYICICAAVLLIFVFNIVVIKTAEPLIVTAEEAYEFAGEDGVDCILVLGASVSQFGPSLILANRLDRGLELFGLGVSKIMLLSGDNGTIEYNEVQAMKEYVLRHGGDVGLDAANVYLDYAGFSTYASAVRCKDVFMAKRVVIVTQRYHLYRAVWNAKMAGLEVVGVAADDTKHGQALRDVREAPARIKDFFLSVFSYTPNIMGDPVPLTYPSTQR